MNIDPSVTDIKSLKEKAWKYVQKYEINIWRPELGSRPVICPICKRTVTNQSYKQKHLSQCLNKAEIDQSKKADYLIVTPDWHAISVM